ncbi:hypothetical protein ACI65C_008704 [Semiaphis heraclei]
MAQVFKLFCFAISALLLLELADAVKGKPSSKGGTDSNGQNGEEHTATFLKNMKSIKNSKPVQIVKGVSGVVEKHLSNFSKDFKSRLNNESKKQLNDDNSLIPNFVKHNMILPGKVAVETSINILKQPVGKALLSAKKKYDDGLIKSKQLAGKAKDKTGKTLSDMYGTVSKWRWGKK